MKRLKRAWRNDRLGMLGGALAGIAFVFWMAPVKFKCWSTYEINSSGFAYQEACNQWRAADTRWFYSGSGFSTYFEPEYWTMTGENYLGYVSWFTTERLPVVGFCFALAVLVLLFRRRDRTDNY